MKRSSTWSINGNAEPTNGDSSQVMAWARDIETGEPVYILELDSSRTKSQCGCECPSCDLHLIAVNAATTAYKRRPHFRHPNGAEKSDCMYLSARLAALQLLRDEGFLLLPKMRKSATSIGLSGVEYEAWVERPAERVAIRDFNFNDKAAAILTLNDGRKLRFELLGNGATFADDGDLIASIRMDITDPSIAGMSIEELRSRISLLPDSLCWLSHWDDADLTAQAKADADKKADDFMDLQSKYAEDLQNVDKRFRHETVLHWEVKNILAESMQLRVPSLKAFAFGSSDSGVDVERQWSRKSEVIPLLAVQTEQRVGSLIPDVMATTAPAHGGLLLVEVTVTNQIQSERRSKIREQNLPTLEIDLSRSGGLVSRAELKEIVVDSLELKSWIHHPEIDAQTKILELEVAAKVGEIDREELERLEYREEVLNTPIEDIISEYIELIIKLAEYDLLDQLSIADLSSKSAVKILLEVTSEKFRIKGYLEAGDPELTDGRQAIIPRILSIKFGTGVGYKLNSAMEVMNAIKQSSSKNSTNHTIFMIAENVYRSEANSYRAEESRNRPNWYVEWVDEVKRSIRAGESTYIRDDKFDRFLSLLFPEMKSALSKEYFKITRANIGTTNIDTNYYDAHEKFKSNMKWWNVNGNQFPGHLPEAGPARPNRYNDPPNLSPAKTEPVKRNLYAEMKGRDTPRHQK